MVALLAACVEADLPKVELHALLRTFQEAAGLSGQVRYTAFAPGMALATDFPQLLAQLGQARGGEGVAEARPRCIREGYD